jgi:hypothetical protein
MMEDILSERTVMFMARAGAIFDAIPWWTVFLVAFATIALIGLVRFHRAQDNRYDLWDLVMERGRADLNKHIIAAFAVLSIWVIVFLVQKGKDVETLLLGVLGIFVANRAITSVTNTIKGVPPDPPMQDRLSTTIPPVPVEEPPTPGK